MAFHNLHDFLYMGGYYAYVWSAYAVFFGSIAIFSIYWIRRLRKERQF